MITVLAIVGGVALAGLFLVIVGYLILMAIAYSQRDM